MQFYIAALTNDSLWNICINSDIVAKYIHLASNSVVMLMQLENKLDLTAEIGNHVTSLLDKW